MSRGMVIIGAGECGARAALELRQAGYAGPVTLVGAEQHLPYERPPLSKEAMTEAEEPQPRTILDADRLKALDVSHLSANAARAIDRGRRHVVLADNLQLPYDKLLLATGATPRILPTAPPGDRVAYLRTFGDAMAIRARLTKGSRLVIVGGGFIGLELACSARRRGVTVTVIEALPQILSRAVPGEIAEAVHIEHRRNGVELLCGSSVATIQPTQDAVHIALAAGNRIDADLLIIGIGAVPCTALAAQAGLAIDNGIAVDARLRTTDPDIFAAGDCCSFPLAVYGDRRVRLEAWRNAQEQGALAARNMLGAAEPHTSVPWFWSDQYDLSLYVAGLTDEGRQIVRRTLADDAFILFHLASDGRLVAASGIGPGNMVAKDIRLAEMLIARQARPPQQVLASADVKLKTLLAA